MAGCRREAAANEEPCWDYRGNFNLCFALSDFSGTILLEVGVADVDVREAVEGEGLRDEKD